MFIVGPNNNTQKFKQQQNIWNYCKIPFYAVHYRAGLFFILILLEEKLKTYFLINLG